MSEELIFEVAKWTEALTAQGRNYPFAELALPGQEETIGSTLECAHKVKTILFGGSVV